MRVGDPPHSMSSNHAAVVSTYRSEPLESKISESIPFPKIAADVESKEEEEYMSHDSASKQPVDIGEELQ